ncbi:Uncharacterised protein [Salmonella enterica subsp. enterica serovar Bovismorbificans]|uniref:Uncharacterized protein n=1 Tax=Salmonella enterica subsp. enterica serovar Bovismorbificans TaxID=58097 RepID=A0A655BMD3_SALET|nr:Uncharacterised protein [Salmonella enterica subsp. enterica serovar Bovismorbificans]
MLTYGAVQRDIARLQTHHRFSRFHARRHQLDNLLKMQFGAVVAFCLRGAVIQQFGIDQRTGIDNYLRLLQQAVAFKRDQLAIARPGADEPYTAWIKCL